MESFEDFETKNLKFDIKSLKGTKASLLTRILLRFWPEKGMIWLARELGLATDLTEKANDLFSKVKRVEIVPSESSFGRGFKIILDRNTALYFEQDGDHFVYDGPEMGEYEKGEVTIFDNLE
ncbi:MAG: hypothetical protein AB1721_00370 [Patescibacteria group bacterium]